MKWVYVAAGIALFVKMLIMSNPAAEWDEISIVESIVNDSGVSNAVSGILFRNRLYDTIFEVVVFTIAILGVGFLLADEKPTKRVYQFSDRPSIVLARLGATITALVSIELAIRGHLSPGGGFGNFSISPGKIPKNSPQRTQNRCPKPKLPGVIEKLLVLLLV